MKGEKLSKIGTFAISMSLIGCANEISPSHTSRPDVSPSLRPLLSYKYRIAYQPKGSNNILICYQDEEFLNESLEWKILIDQAYCPDQSANLQILKSEDIEVSGVMLDINPNSENNFQIVDQEVFIQNGEEIPPVQF